MPQKRTALVASLDIGTSKIACMIAGPEAVSAERALRGRKPCGRVDRYSQIQSRGLKAGAVVDLRRNASRRCARRCRSLSAWPRFVSSQSCCRSPAPGDGSVDGGGRRYSRGAVTAQTSAGSPPPGCATPPARAAPCCTLAGQLFLDGVKGIRDPRGMLARQSAST